MKQKILIILLAAGALVLIVGGVQYFRSADEGAISQQAIEQVARLRCTHPNCNGEVETTVNDLMARGCIGIDLEMVGRPPDQCARCPKCGQLSLEYVNTSREVGDR